MDEMFFSPPFYLPCVNGLWFNVNPTTAVHSKKHTELVLPLTEVDTECLLTVAAGWKTDIGTPAFLSKEYLLNTRYPVPSVPDFSDGHTHPSTFYPIALASSAITVTGPKSEKLSTAEGRDLMVLCRYIRCSFQTVLQSYPKNATANILSTMKTLGPMLV